MTHQGRDAAVELSGLLAVFLESYRLVAQCLEPLESTPQPRQALLEEILGQGKKHLLEGRLRRAEAISQITLKNALALFRSIGVITGSEAGLVPGDGRHQREEIEEELRAFLTVLP